MRIGDIAQLAGVSISTVSKIINGKDQTINPKTRERVLSIVREYNYVPYASTKNVSDQKNFLIGFLSSGSPQMQAVLAGVVDEAQRHNYGVVVCGSDENYRQETKCVTILCRNKVNGVLWEKVSQESDLSERFFEEQGIPFSVLGHSIAESNGHSSMDCLQWGYEAAKKLTNYGHLRIGCIVRPKKLSSQAFFEGFRRCLFERQVIFDEQKCLIDADTLTQDIFLRGFSGFICVDADAGENLCSLARQFTLKIPRDLSVVAISDDGKKRPSGNMSLISQPMRAFGGFICESLITRVEKTGPPAAVPFSWNTDLDGEEGIDVPYDSRKKSILVVGSVHMDILIDVGELPQIGKTVTTSAITTIPGGKGLNQAIGAARLGAKVSLIARVGRDAESTNIHQNLIDNHIDPQGLEVDEYESTGKAFIYIQPDGDSSIVNYDGANNSLCPGDVLKNETFFKDAGYCLLPMEIPLETVEFAAETARRHGAKTILKPAAIKEIKPSLLKNVDIFIPNEKEAGTLCPQGKTIEERALCFLEKGAGNVIITLGSQGCYLKNHRHEKYFPSYPFQALDTTGAADAFICALAVYLNENLDIVEAIPRANCAAGFCVSRRGVLPAMVDRTTLELYLSSRGLL
ncbi:MAG: PfkB family carbohydrate kinase [Synergistaceae bacterium]|nr:PfkB family carbohydrate kinase [Synergistaceae bacterium]